MKKNFKMSFIALSLVIAVLLTACSKVENNVNEEITASESVSDSSAETKSETTTAEAETSFETTAAEAEASTDATTSESEQSSASESEEESVSESDTATEEKTKSTSESTSATTTEATILITAESTEAAVTESEQTNVSEKEAVTEEKTSDTEESLSEEMSAIQSAVSLHELHKEEDKTITLNVKAPGYSDFPFDAGWFSSLYYQDMGYECACHCEFLSDADRNITVLEQFNDEIDDVVMNFDKLEYIGTIGETNLQAGSFNEADVYQYEDKLIIIYNVDWYPLFVWGFREQFYGFSFDENNKIGNDPEKLREVLLERGVEYDSSVFLCALMYVKSDRV